MQDALTPMMQQYQRLRKSIPADTLLLFRLGDFYELFFEDAKEASVLLNVALTKRNEVPMCGVPYHAAPGYIANWREVASNPKGRIYRPRQIYVGAPKRDYVPIGQRG